MPFSVRWTSHAHHPRGYKLSPSRAFKDSRQSARNADCPFAISAPMHVLSVLFYLCQKSFFSMLSCCSSALPYCNAIIRAQNPLFPTMYLAATFIPVPHYCPGIGQFQGAVENFSDGYFKSVFLKKIKYSCGVHL